MTDTVVLVDFSGLSWTCYEPALSAQVAGEQALAEHKTKCALCEMGDPCDSKPRQYDARQILLTNIDLKIGTLSESIDTSVKTWIMVKDGKDARRRFLWPAYKANREKKPFDPRPLTEEYLRKKGCRFCWSPEAEADDTIATMARDLSESGMNVIIVSSDKDLWQCWDPPRVRIYLTTKKEFLTREYMEKKLRVTEPGQVRLIKALWGDPSDNIPNAIPRMQAQLVPLVKSCNGSLQDFLAQTQRMPLSARCQQLLKEQLSQVLTNWDVVGLYLDVPVVWLP
jgi:5'-3' exonuclease